MRPLPLAAGLAVLFAVAVIPGLARADSPLTSTTFHAAYADVEPVARVARDGLTPATMDDLSDVAVPHDVRAAMVNALGWRGGRQRGNSRTYLDHIATRHGRPAARLRPADLSAQEALALGYMVAMDHYLDLAPIGGRGALARAAPARILGQARRQAPNDFTVALILGLVRAQGFLHKTNRWCRVHREVFSVVNGGPSNMRQAALDAITGYMQSYQSYCGP